MTITDSWKIKDAFEIKSKDLLGRVGRLRTKSGSIETPCLFPVVHPTNQIVAPKEIREMGYEAVMTNAYLTRRAFGPDVKKGIHEILGFEGPVATDSGAYQILTYGDIEANQAEMIEFQERIGSDIAVILDIPTGLTANRRYAERTVEETVRRADQAIASIKGQETLWVGPIQGGIHLDLVAQCAEEMNSRHFTILALGSPTQVMEQYMYKELVQMILACKANIQSNRPLHLFGAGHPSMLALAVSLGCDLFDSASYALYARRNRYLTSSGTIRLEDIEYLPCSCSVCNNSSIKDLVDSPPQERMRKLSIHNLNVCLEEIRRIKQSIVEGRLWELVLQRVRSHPKLYESVNILWKYRSLFEGQSPISKKKGLFFFDYLDLDRPEVTRFRQYVVKRYSLPDESRVLILLPPPLTKPWGTDKHVKELLRSLDKPESYHVCFYKIPYGAVPIELSEVYPVAQTEISRHVDIPTISDSAEALIEYMRHFKYNEVFLHVSDEVWDKKVVSKVRRLCREEHQKLVVSYQGQDVWGVKALQSLSALLKRRRTVTKKPK